jgi:hypothetical protein
MSSKSDNFFQSIINGDDDPRLKESLKRIKEVCDDIIAHGGRIYVSIVGKRCEKKFGWPKAQSIRNKPKTLNKYVEIREAERRKPVVKSDQGILQTISDPKIRAYILLLEAANQDMTNENARLLKAFNNIAPLEIDKAIAQLPTKSLSLNISETDTFDGKPRSLKLGEVAHRAIGKITSEEHLGQAGLRLYKGHLLTQTNFTFLDKDEVAALLDLLRGKSNEQR